MRSRPVNPRASRIALIVASVPELTIRSSSIDGMRADDPAASSVSMTVGAPNERPSIAGA